MIGTGCLRRRNDWLWLREIAYAMLVAELIVFSDRRSPGKNSLVMYP